MKIVAKADGDSVLDLEWVIVLGWLVGWLIDWVVGWLGTCLVGYFADDEGR